MAHLVIVNINLNPLQSWQSSTHEALQLISSALSDYTEAIALLRQDDIRLRVSSDISDALHRRLTNIKTRLLNILVSVLESSNPLQHLSPESEDSQLIRTILQGCAATVFIAGRNLKDSARDSSNVKVPWDQTLGLLETFDGSLQRLAPMGTVSGVRFDISDRDAIRRHASRALDAKSTFGASEAFSPAQSVHPASNDENASPEQLTQAHLNCEGYNRGLEEGQRKLHQVCDTLRAMNIVGGGPGREGNVTWLAQAIKRHDIRGVNLLLDLGADVNGLSPQADSQEPKDLPLCLASRYSLTDVVDALLARGARIEARNAFGNTPLLSAAAAGRVSMIKYLVRDCHANIEATKDSTPREGYTPLATAAFFGHLRTLQSLVDEGANTRWLSRKGGTLLHIAANQGHKTVVEHLIQTGSQIGEQNRVTGDTALHYAIRKGRKEVAQDLISRMPSILKIPNNKAQTPLHMAVEYKQLEMVRLLLSQDAVETKAQDHLGKTASQYALSIQDDERNTSLAILEELLAKYRPGELFDRGFHVLSQAARDDKFLHVQKIVGKDPGLIKILPSSDSGFYPVLHEAVIHGRESIVKLLGPFPETNPNLADRSGKTPLHHAILNGRDQILEALFAMGADVNLANMKNGYYPLHYAAEAQNYGAMKELVRRGANPSIRIPGPACHLCTRKGKSKMNARCLLLNLPENTRRREFDEMSIFLRDAMNR